MSLTCLSTIAFLIASRPASGPFTFWAWIRPQRTTLGMGRLPSEWNTNYAARYHRAPMAPASPDAGVAGRPGLVRAIGRWDLTAAIVNGVVGSAVFSLPSVIAGLTGTLSPFAFVFAALGIVTTLPGT